MRKVKLVVAAGAAGMMILAGSVQAAGHAAKPGAEAPKAAAAPAAAPAPKKEETGKDIAFNNRKGNCLACHAMPSQPDALSPGLYGPPLIAMSARFPDKAKLRAQIWDATAINPNSSMPPLGKHKILTEQEIDKVTDFIYSL